MENALKAEGWTVLNHEGEVIAEGLPSKAAAVHAVLTDDGHDYEIRRDEDGAWWLWLTTVSRNRAGGDHRLQRSMIFSLANDESAAEAEIFAEIAVTSRWWHGPYSGYEILTDAYRAAGLVELAEDEEGADDLEAWFAFYPVGRRGDAVYGWGTRAEAERYQAFENRDRDPDAKDWNLMDRVDGEDTDNLDGFNIDDFFAGNPEAAAA